MLRTESNSLVVPADADLVRGTAAGDMEAFAALIRRHQQYVRNLAYRITGAADAADDIAQETFLRVHRNARTYRPTAAFTTWLYRIVVNLCLDRAKRPRLARLHDEALDGSKPDDALGREECAQAVRREVQALPDRQRIALILHRFEGQTHVQIAESTGWSVSAVETLLVRAYAQLRERLKQWQT